LRIEGKLAGDGVDTVASALADATYVAVDVAGVTFADARGGELLRALRAKGVEVRGASAFVRALMQQGG
jgi:hypothetical protein